jgi:importin-5
MYPMLNTLPRLPNAHVPGLILLSADQGPTPTVAHPLPTPHFSFSFPPVPSLDVVTGEDEADEEKEEVWKAALEFMITLSEAKPSMVRKQDGWIPAIVRGCWEGMGEFPDDKEGIVE